jgi:glucoselysine-6-phosphate deglycase
MQPTMYTYIEEEYQVCKKILENRKGNLKDFIDILKEKDSSTKLMFLATGSSVNAVNCVKFYLEQLLGFEVAIKIPFLFSNYEKVFNTKAIAIAVSQGGKSHSTIEAVIKAKEYGIQDTIVITSDLNSPITTYADKVIDIGCGEEKVGFVTKGFTATVLTLMLMAVEGGYALGRIDESQYELEINKINEAVEKINNVIERTNHWYDKNRHQLIAGNRFLTIAYGPNYGVALESNTKITETVRCPMSSYELEEYMHGPYLELKDNHYIFFVQSKGKVEDRLLSLREYISRVTPNCFTISHEERCEDARTLCLGFDGDENISPLLFVIPFQILSYKLAEDKGINLNIRIYSDFSTVLNSKVSV